MIDFTKNSQINVYADMRTMNAFKNICKRKGTNTSAVIRQFIDYYIASNMLIIGECKTYINQNRDADYANYFNQLNKKQ